MGFLRVRLEAIDRLHRCIGIERETVWSVAHNIAVLLVQLVEVFVPFATPSMVDRIPIRQAPKKGSRIFGKRMKCQAIDSD